MNMANTSARWLGGLLGMSDAEIDALEAAGVIARRESATERES